MNALNESKSNSLPTEVWQQCADAVLLKLNDDDDASLWEIVIDTVIAETMEVLTEYREKEAVILEIGRCSHWIRPHCTSSKDGTRLPYGYNDTVDGYSLRSLPQFDWSLRWSFSFERKQWSFAVGQPSRRPLTNRIAIPARTLLHQQATVHAIWTPGSPTDPKNKLETIYGFERKGRIWESFARSTSKHRS